MPSNAAVYQVHGSIESIMCSDLPANLDQLGAEYGGSVLKELLILSFWTETDSLFLTYIPLPNHITELLYHEQLA